MDGRNVSTGLRSGGEFEGAAGVRVGWGGGGEEDACEERLEGAFAGADGVVSNKNEGQPQIIFLPSHTLWAEFENLSAGSSPLTFHDLPGIITGVRAAVRHIPYELTRYSFLYSKTALRHRPSEEVKRSGREGAAKERGSEKSLRPVVGSPSGQLVILLCICVVVSTGGFAFLVSGPVRAPSYLGPGPSPHLQSPPPTPPHAFLALPPLVFQAPLPKGPIQGVGDPNIPSPGQRRSGDRFTARSQTAHDACRRYRTRCLIKSSLREREVGSSVEEGHERDPGRGYLSSYNRLAPPLPKKSLTMRSVQMPPKSGLIPSLQTRPTSHLGALSLKPPQCCPLWAWETLGWVKRHGRDAGAWGSDAPGLELGRLVADAATVGVSANEVTSETRSANGGVEDEVAADLALLSLQMGEKREEHFQCYSRWLGAYASKVGVDAFLADEAELALGGVEVESAAVLTLEGLGKIGAGEAPWTRRWSRVKRQALAVGSTYNRGSGAPGLEQGHLAADAAAVGVAADEITDEIRSANGGVEDEVAADLALLSLQMGEKRKEVGLSLDEQKAPPLYASKVMVDGLLADEAELALGGVEIEAAAVLTLADL
ncbi:hypothetical protein BDK51DRAFT_46335, partial [Blyttiomyces helicus]